MVGRLVQEENVGGRREHARERGTARLAAREARGSLFAVKAELAQKIVGAVAVIARRKSRLDKGARGGKAGEIGLLRQIADGGSGLDEARAGIGFDKPGSDFQQRRLARAVAPDKAQTLALGEGKLRALEQRRAAEAEANVLKKKERRHCDAEPSPCRELMLS